MGRELAGPQACRTCQQAVEQLSVDGQGNVGRAWGSVAAPCSPIHSSVTPSSGSPGASRKPQPAPSRRFKPMLNRHYAV